jgi:hypothetical protein
MRRGRRAWRVVGRPHGSMTAGRWATAQVVSTVETPSNNTMPTLPSQPQRIVGWATLALVRDGAVRRSLDCRSVGIESVVLSLRRTTRDTFQSVVYL